MLGNFFIGGSTMENKCISILLPAYNEGENITRIFEALQRELKKTSYQYEIIYVNDGSSDDTLSRIKNLADQYEEVKYISFTRNFGKEAALLAGLRYSNGDALIIMDADLQHPTELIHDLIVGYEEGYGQVVARRNRKGESKIRSKLSSMYYGIIDRVVKDVQLKDGEGDFRLLSREAVDAVLTLSEGNRFSKGLFSWIGFEKKIIEFENIAREQGESKWSYKQLINYGVDGIISFNQAPLRFVFYVGLVTMLLALGYITAMFIQLLLHGINVPGYFTLISSILFLGGIQLVSLGIIGEYIGRIYLEVKDRPHYLVQEKNIERKKDEVIK